MLASRSKAAAVMVVMIACFGLVACGSKSVLARAYGGLSARDQSAFKKVLKDSQTVGEDYLPMIHQLTTHDQSAKMQTALDAFDNAVTNGQEDAAVLGKASLRNASVQLFAAYEQIGNVASRVVIADGDPQTTDAEGQQLIADFQNAVATERTSYVTFIQGLAKYLTPAQQRRLKASEQQYQTSESKAAG